MAARREPRTGVGVRQVAATALLMVAVSTLGCGADASGGRLPDAQPRARVATNVAATSGTPALHHELTVNGLDRVSVADARLAYDARIATFVDVRDAASYRAAHIPGAVSIPLDQLAGRVAELDRGRVLITYCT